MKEIKFLFPIDGDFVNNRDGEWVDGALCVEFLLKADSTPTVNGVKAEFCEQKDCYVAKVPLYGYRNSVVAKTDDAENIITVFVLTDDKLKKYRLSSDDNIRFLKELTEGDYKSIFDHPYLAVYKKAHDTYGAKVHLNIHYAFDDEARKAFSLPHEYFDLSMMTDRYKDEFIANSDWLKLSFHSESEKPDKPYKYADRKTVREHSIAIYREICRFAGKECISNTTTIHWGEGNREVVRELRSLGIRALMGYFNLNNGVPSVSYYLENELVDHLCYRDFWMDTKEDMIFGRIDRVLNVNSNIDDVLKNVTEVAEHPHRNGFVSLMIHEQYFYPDYNIPRPDFEARIMESCKILYERGYEGAHISDIIKEPDLCDNPRFK